MAETYLTPSFQNATKPQDQSAPGEQTGGGEQYQTDTFKKATQGGGGETTQTTGGQQTTQPSQGWGINWHGDVTMPIPQSVQDFGNVAANEAMAYGIPSLRTEAEAARKRLDPATAAGADFVGATLSPTQLLNAVPYAGPELAGATHEGIKSAVTNWKPDESWGDYAKNVAEDTAFGAATGGFGRVLSSQAPKYFGDAVRETVKGAPAGLLGLHLFNAGHDLVHNLGTAASVFGLYGGLSRAGNWAGEQVEHLGSSPYVQQAIKSLILGGGSAARQQIDRPLDQLVIPQGP